jgi:hypothetical protein
MDKNKAIFPQFGVKNRQLSQSVEKLTQSGRYQSLA